MDCVTELAKEVVTKLGDLVVESTVNHFQYLIQHETIITNLKEEQEKLKGMKQALQGRVDAEIRKGYEIVPNVQKWLSDVAAIEDQLRNFYENIEVSNSKNKQKCFHGQCPNLALNYSLGKRATKSTQHITSLKEGEKYLDQNQIISYRKAPAPTFLEDILKLESRNKIIEDVIEKLKNDEIKRISVCGMGGVGKTTLVKELIQIVEMSKQFDKVVMAVVSQNPNYEKIQNQIVDGLGLKMESAIMDGKARELHQWLIEEKSGKVLIVLDDVWGELKFEQIGIPSRDHQKQGIKILFTSRNEKVCQNMRSQDNFQVSVLSMEEAWSLFREMAGDVVDELDINPIAREIANECGGLPLAIVTVGRALSKEKKLAWTVVRNQLRNSQVSSFSEMQELVYSRIELSFNFLGNEHKCCLLLCGLFPEDYDIPVESLFRYGAGLGLFEEALGTLWELRNQVNDVVNNLKRCFLLLDSDKPGCVKMHDVVRDVVLKVTFSEQLGIFVHNNVESKRLTQGKWRRMSLVLDDMHMTELENVSECPPPTLEILQVQAQRKATIPWLENFIRGTSKLKVLALQNLCIPQIPSLHQTLVNLQMLQVEGCDVGDISIIGKELKKLEILSFAYSNIKELPNEIGQLGFLRLLDLTECDDLNFISANVLARLSQLEEFYFRVNNFPWMLNRVFIEELGVISNQLKVLEIKVSNKENFPSNWIFKNLEFFWVYMVPYLDSNVRQGYLDSNILYLKYTNCSSIKNTQLAEKCEVLRLKKVEDLKNVVIQLDDNGLQYLKDLRIVSCPNVEFVINLNDHSLCCAFPLIKSLFLKNLTKLREVLHASDHHEFKTSMIGFSNLLELELRMLPNFIGFSNALDLNGHNQPIYPRLSSAAKLASATNVEDGEMLSNGDKFYQVSPKLFSFNWMKQFPKLKKILLDNCISLEIVFDLQGYSQSNGDALLFPQLESIVISSLSKLTFVWYNVSNCVMGFQSLRSLTISNCDSLTHVFTSTIVKAITNLETLEVKSCKLIENIIVWNDMDTEEGKNEGKGQVENINMFSKLRFVLFSRLPKLVRICSESFMYKWPSLRHFEIDDCPMLEISLLPTPIQANQDSLNDTYNGSTEDIGFLDFKDKKSRWPLNFSHGCMFFRPSFTLQGNTNRRRSKEVIALAPDHAPFIYEMKSKEKIDHMPILDNLFIRKCHLMGVKCLLEEKYNLIIPWNLKAIQIEACIKLKSIVAVREERQDINVNLFPQLESLHLSELPNLVTIGFSKIFDKHQEMGTCEEDHLRITHQTLMDGSSFPNLTYLSIEACNKINILFSYFTLISLEQLKKLEVKDCKNMEKIVNHEETETSKEKTFLHNLQHLVLNKLPNLKFFYQGSSHFNFPSLEEVEIKDCPTMEVFLQGSLHTPKLKNVTMEIKSYHCSYIQNKDKDLNATIQGFKAFVSLKESDKLDWAELHKKGIFEYFLKKSETLAIESFQHLRELRIIDCDSLTEVFETKKEDVTHYELQNLQHNIIRRASFQELTFITIYSCPSLKSLLSYSMAKSLERLQELCVCRCDLMEEIVTKEDSEGGSKVTILFPQLTELTLCDLPNLECVYSGGYNYDLPLCDDVVHIEGNEMNNDNNKIQISFPKLERLELNGVPKLKCFCAGAYDYDIMNISSIEGCPTTSRFPKANVIVSTPNLHQVNEQWWNQMYTYRDLNLMIHYAHNRKKYQGELQKLDTFRGLEREERIFGHIKRETQLHLQGCHKLLSCIPSNMMNLLFSHLTELHIRDCECLEEIFESSDYEGDNKVKRYDLERLELYYLPKVKHIWKNHGQVSCFQNLWSIDISQCHDLRYVFPDVSTAKSLPKLFKIYVSECNNMEEIFQNESNSNCSREQQQQQLKEAKIIFSKLDQIKLVKLPRLNSFLPSTFSCYVELPRCSGIVIEECPKMKCFCYDGNLYTPSLYWLSVEGADFDTNEDLNEVLQQRKWSERALLE